MDDEQPRVGTINTTHTEPFGSSPTADQSMTRSGGDTGEGGEGVPEGTIPGSWPYASEGDGSATDDVPESPFDVSETTE